MILPPERSAERDAAVEAMLPNVPFDGWTKRALRAGGVAAEDADFLFPRGAVEMIEVFCDLADRRMEEAAENLAETRLSRRVRAVIALRLQQNRPHKEAIRRALAVLALPRNSRVAASSMARTVDAIWRAAGDQSADISWYTKRAILAGVYSATLLYWLRDFSEEDAATLAFLDRRLAGIGRIGRVRSQVEGALDRLPLPRMLRTGDTG
ncbi:MAG TPA: COQ9 family protein [Rhodopila sp.]|nr:COQ9 family protein [Rhodopila sp.]